MENLKKLLGDGYHEGMTVEEINSALNGKNFVDLKSGRYVDKNKYDSLKTDYDILKEQTKDYDEIKTSNENLKNEKKKAEYLSKIKEQKVDDKFANFVLSEVEQNDKFEENLKTYLKNNPQYVINNDNSKIISSGPSLEKGSNPTQNENATMNDTFRNAFSNN